MMKKLFDNALPPLNRYEAKIVGGILVAVTFGYCMALAATRQ